MKTISLVSFNEESAFCTYLQKSFPKQTDAFEEDDSLATKNEITLPPDFSHIRKTPSPKYPPLQTRNVKKEICLWFFKGNCRFGSECRNVHEKCTPQISNAQPVAKIFQPVAKNVRRKFGEEFQPVAKNVRRKFVEEFQPVAKACRICPDSAVSSLGSESDFELDSNCATDNEDQHRFAGVYILVDGQLQFVPGVASSDPDGLVCWDFNTKFGCTYPNCSWEHRPCRTTKAHPTKFGRICSPQHGLRNMQKENDELMKDQKRKLRNLGFLLNSCSPHYAF